jgi:hypothetical protein
MFQVGLQRGLLRHLLASSLDTAVVQHGEIGWLAIYVVGIGRSACLPASRCSVHLT